MDKKDSIKQIKKLVNEYYGFNIAKKTRKLEYVRARAVFYHLALKTGNTLAKVGKSVGKDHATVVHARKTLLNHIDKPSKRKIKEDVEALEKLLDEKIVYNGKKFSSKTVISKQIQAIKQKDEEIHALKEKNNILESITEGLDHPVLAEASELLKNLDGFEEKLEALCKINKRLLAASSYQHI